MNKLTQMPHAGFAFATLVIAILVFSAMAQVAFSPEIKVRKAATTGDSREDDLIVNGTAISKSGKLAYSSIHVYNGGSLTINGAGTIVTVTGAMIIEDKASKIKIQDSSITVKGGSFYASCAQITMTDSTIWVKNQTMPGPGGTGNPSKIYWEIRSDAVSASVLNIDGCTITNEATDGGGGVSGANGHGGDGGLSDVYIASNHGNYKVAVKDSSITGKAGAGGKCGSGDAGNHGGKGGESKLHIESANALEFENVQIYSYGGEGGDRVSPGTGGAGGQSYDVVFKSVASFTLRNSIEDQTGPSSILLSKGGDGHNSLTGSVIEANSQIQLFSAKDMVFNDNPPPSRQAELLTTLQTKILAIDAAGAGSDTAGAKFYNVECVNHTGVEIVPTAIQNEKTVDMYWWLDVVVEGNDGTPLEGAMVTVENVNTGINMHEGNTDTKGLIQFLVLGYSLTSAAATRTPINYNIHAALLGITADRMQYTVINKQELRFTLQLISVIITSIQGVPIGENVADHWNMVVGGIVDIKGTATPPSGSTQKINQAWMIIDNGGNSPVTDTSEDTEKPYSTWEYKWDTAFIAAKKICTLEIYATDGQFISKVVINLTVDQAAANHAPKVSSLTLSTTQKLDDKQYIVDSDTSTKTYITAHLKEELDWASQILESGKVIKSAQIYLYSDFMTEPILISSSVKEATGGAGEYTLNYTWNTRKMTGDQFDFPNGEYTISLKCVDDGDPPLYSDNATIICKLYHQVQPRADVTKLGLKESDGKIFWKDANTPDNRKFKSPEPAKYSTLRSITIGFSGEGTSDGTSLTGSYDLNGPNFNRNDPTTWPGDLDFYWNFGDGTAWIKGDFKQFHTFNVTKEDKAYKADGKFSKDYTITLQVKDKEGLSNEYQFKIEVEFTPPPIPPMGILATVTGFSLPLHETLWLIVIIAVMVIANLAGVAIIFIRRMMVEKNAEKSKKALAAAKQKRAQASANKGESTAFTGYKKAAPGAQQHYAGATDLSSVDMSMFQAAPGAPQPQQTYDQKLTVKPGVDQNMILEVKPGVDQNMRLEVQKVPQGQQQQAPPMQPAPGQQYQT